MNRINIGCGPYKEEGHINIDINPRHEPDMVHDITKGLPFEDSTLVEVRASHILEHFNSDDCIFILKEAWRVLKNNGLLDINVPIGLTGDLDHKSYFEEYTFDLLTREDCKIYFDTLMLWREESRKQFPEGKYHTTFNIRLRAVK